MPVLMETMAYLAEEAGVEYTTGTNKEIDDTPNDSAVARAIKLW